MNLFIDLKNNKFNMQLLFITLCSLLPFVDSINGVLSGHASIGSVYKILLLAVLGLSLILSKVKPDHIKLKVLAILVLYITIIVLCNSKVFGDSILSNSIPIKMIFNIVFFFLLSEALVNNVLSKQSLFMILNNSSWVFIVCFLIPYILGLGNTIYAHGMGYKAFFISQNELSFVLLALCLFAAYELHVKITVVRVIQLVLLAMCGFLINTKSTIFGCLLAIVILVFEKIKKSDLRIKLTTLGVVLVFAFIFKNLLFSSIGSVISRFTSLKSNYYNGSILTAILSGRNLYIQSAWTYLVKKHFIFRLIFGNGFCTKYLVEMDFVDMFFFMGIIGEAIFIYFMYRLGKNIYKMKEQDGCRIRFLYFCIVLAFMFITGHVIFMAMSGTYFVLFCCYLISNQMDQGDTEDVRA